MKENLKNNKRWKRNKRLCLLWEMFYIFICSALRLIADVIAIPLSLSPSLSIFLSLSVSLYPFLRLCESRTFHHRAKWYRLELLHTHHIDCDVKMDHNIHLVEFISNECMSSRRYICYLILYIVCSFVRCVCMYVVYVMCIDDVKTKSNLWTCWLFSLCCFPHLVNVWLKR